jgi:hypothetical protein
MVLLTIKNSIYYLDLWNGSWEPGTMEQNWMDISIIPQASSSKECPIKNIEFWTCF